MGELRLLPLAYFPFILFHNQERVLACPNTNKLYLPVIIPEYVVVGWSAGPLDSLVGAQVEVELGGVGDPDVHGGPRRNVA